MSDRSGVPRAVLGMSSNGSSNLVFADRNGVHQGRARRGRPGPGLVHPGRPRGPPSRPSPSPSRTPPTRLRWTANPGRPPNRPPERNSRAHPRHRRRRLHRLPPVRPPAGRGPPGRLPRQLLHRPPGEHRAPAGPPAFELLRHDVCEPLFIEVDQIYNLACPASPVHYQYNPVKTVKSNVMGTLNMLVLAKRVRRPDPPGVHVGGLRRPDRPSADRELLGQREPDRPARLLRRGQARGRDADVGLSPRGQRGHPDRPDLQHLRARGWRRTTGGWSPTSSSRRSAGRS